MNYTLKEKYDSICSGLKSRQIKCHLSDFQPKVGQDEALNAIADFAGDFMANKNPTGLLLVGGVGSGKTYLVASLVNYLAEAMELYSYDDYSEDYINYLKADYLWILQNKGVCFIVLSELLEYLKDCYSNDETWKSKRITEHLRKIDLLVLDDMGAEKTSDWTKELLFNIIDYRYNEQLPMIVTTNCVPEELKEKIGDRNFDRLREMCALVTVTAESQRETAKIKTQEAQSVVITN